jgi:sugar phosphate isomerase/epimerase
MPVGRIAVNDSIFDGHDFHTVLDELAKLGIGRIEPSFTQGYTEDRGRTFFSEANGCRIGRRIAEAGLDCIAVSSHIDLGEPDAAELFRERIAFAAGLGARIVISNSTDRAKRDPFLRTMALLARFAESSGVAIALENPGHGAGTLIDGGRTGAEVLAEIDSDWVRLNCDIGNVHTYFHGAVDPRADLAAALPWAAHLHLKDVAACEGGWQYVPIGDGDVGYGPILGDIAASRWDIPIALEIPLRLSRPGRRAPTRGPAPVPLSDIRTALARSLAFVRGALS